jgi:hypothetical protein|tara:strand:- start:54 stop:272 length:219 start_codon:yes stop_codon:yes gene_type:complete
VGPNSIPVYNDKGEVLPEEVAGLFAQALMKYVPALPIIQDNELRNKQAREKFVFQVCCVDGDTRTRVKNSLY